MDIKQAITDKIISILERGAKQGTARWTGASKGGLPVNGKTGEAYRGVNVLLLWAEAADRSYGSNVWLTYKQADSLGGQVRKGEKAVMCAYFDRVAKNADIEKSGDGDEGQRNAYFMCKPFWVFNANQIDGLPESVVNSAPTTVAFDPISDAERLLASCGATIRHGFDGAFYAPGKDEICLPNCERFTSPENYYATALHELTHWTGHADRKARTFGKRFGDDAYAFEELVAELGAAFLGGHVGIVDATLENHASYLENWLSVLKRDKGAIFSAARHASEASDYILQASTAREVEQAA
jgi:antirestriction protein ArdC